MAIDKFESMDSPLIEWKYHQIKQNDCVKGEKYETYFLSILQETKSVDGQWRKQKNGTFLPFLHLFGFFVVGFVWLLWFFSQFSLS